jgi:hypothetical protein
MVNIRLDMSRYVYIGITKGVFAMDDIYDGNAESDDEKTFWLAIERTNKVAWLEENISNAGGDAVLVLEIYLAGLLVKK